MAKGDETLRPAQLRGILNYVPLFRDHCFVVALDSAVVAHRALPDLAKDLAVLNSLRIRLVVIFGVGHYLEKLARRRRKPCPAAHGEGPIDAVTLNLAEEAADTASRTLLRGLTAHRLRWVVPHAVRAEPVGIHSGQDHGYAGRVARLDAELLRQLLAEDTVPVLSPIQPNRDGQPLRLNSDELAAVVASQLQASKLIYLSAQEGLLIDGRARINLPMAELRALYDRQPERLDPAQLAKVRHALHALSAGVDRTHLLDGRVNGAILTEVFDKVGLGTMIHADAYQQIRLARPKDVSAIFGILQAGARTEALRKVPRKQVEAEIRTYFVYEADGAIIGCARLQPLDDPACAELAGVLVHPAYQRKGIGQLLTRYGIDEARRRGFTTLFALTTQAGDFFANHGFLPAKADDLPIARRKSLEASGRNSHVYACPL